MNCKSLLALVVVVAASCTGNRKDDPTHDTSPPDELVPSPYTSWNDPVSSALREGLPGADIREGWIEWLVQERCVPVLLETWTCHGANPASPYANYQFPEDDDGISNIPDYQLEQHEAVVWVGMTPTAGRYFSWNHHQYDKHVPGGEPINTFATHSPSLHFDDVVTGDSATAPWDAFTIVAHTANEATGERLRELLGPVVEQAGYSRDVINVVPIAYMTEADREAEIAQGRDTADLFELHLGYGEQADTHNMVFRVAAPPDESDPYLTTEHVRAAAFKIALHDPPAYDPWPWPDMPPEDETDERQGQALRDAQLAVFEAVKLLVPSTLATIEVATENGPQKTGADCINLVDACGGNNDDARYLRTDKRFQIPDPDEPFASVFLVGVNHSEVRDRNPSAPRVTYSSVTMNNFTRGFGLRTFLDTELKGNLADWFERDELPQLTDDEFESLYVLQFARNCDTFPWAGQHEWCFEFGEDVLGVCPNDRFWFVERVYLNQTTWTAPHEASLWEALVLGVGPRIEEVSIGGPAQTAIYLNEPPRPVPPAESWCVPEDTETP